MVSNAQEFYELAKVVNYALTLPRTMAISNVAHVARSVEALGRKHILTVESTDVLLIQRWCGKAILAIADGEDYLPLLNRLEDMLLAMAR